ncbi:MAG: hypothetical protein IJ396_04665 [Oscillibacter sp.]|nr:hypothetical protein [Oscillibacter sp.]
MGDHDTARFYASLFRYCLVFLLIAAALLLGLAALLLWKPELFWELFRFSAAAVCTIGALWFLIALLRVVFHARR